MPAKPAALAAALVAAFSAAAFDTAATAAETRTVHALAMHGEPKYGPDFKHFDYANPDAPKGGEIRFAAIGTFDTPHPFTLKGTAAGGAGAAVRTRPGGGGG